VKQAAEARGLQVDISTSDEDTLFGDDWYRFLGDCRFVVGAEGGLSIWDPYGEIADRIEAYVPQHPDAEFEEIEAACFPDEDGRYIFSGFSPRIFEAALSGCCQILVEGEYRGILRPYEHYVPLKKDCSNLDEVFALMEDESETLRRIKATYRTLIEDPQYRYSHLVDQVMSYIRAKLDGQGKSANEPCFDDLVAKHQDELEAAVIREAEAEGFAGEPLVRQIEYLLGGQFAEPQVFPGRHSAPLFRLFRSYVRQRARLHVAQREAEERMAAVMTELAGPKVGAAEDAEQVLGAPRLIDFSGLRAAFGDRLLRLFKGIT
jgi:hypothetical protein